LAVQTNERELELKITAPEPEKVEQIQQAIKDMTKTITDHEARIEELERRLQRILC
jgi:predicted RNase H-like nuclease (RuvC/YqgF family)